MNLNILRAISKLSNTPLGDLVQTTFAEIVDEYIKNNNVSEDGQKVINDFVKYLQVKANEFIG